MDIRNYSMAKIVGPFWIASARLIPSRDPELNLALRTIFVENQPRGAFGQGAVFVPGTLLILCQIHRVSIRPEGPHGENYDWKRQSGSPIRDPSIAEIREGLASGELSLLLMQAPENDWPEEDNQQASIPTLTCLVGDINLDVMEPMQQDGQTENARQRLYRGLTLLEDAASSGPLTGKLSVNGSGLSIHGQIKLPWAAERVTAPFLLAKELPSPDKSRFLLRLEEERLTDLEKLAWIQNWFNLSSYLNPNHPLHKLEGPIMTPVWTTLEIADPLRVPGIFWRLPGWESAPANLPPQFKAGEFNLLLSDQELYEPQRPSRSVAQIPLKSIQINEGVNDTLHIELLAGEPQPEVHGRVQYTASTPADPSQAWQESVTILDTDVAFNPVTTARLLRQHQDLLPPEWEAGEEAEPIDTPTLWGFMPLADGWAQLPIPNLTEQLFLDTQIANLDYEEKASLVKGAFALSNQQDPILTHFAQEQPWQMALTDIGNLQGQWQLQRQGDGYQLNTITLDIQSPQLQLTGFFWLSTGKPTVEDALPDMENWISGLQTVPLRTFSRGNHIFPPAITLRLEMMALTPRPFPAEKPTLTSTQLGTWAFAYQTQTDTFTDLVNANVLPEGMYGRYLPLIWRRHPAHPMIQVLPLTQSKSPPNHPSASRQLAPYEIQPEIPLRFGVSSEQGASSWVDYLGTDEPAVEWRELVDLPMASLTLPGFFLDPSLQEGAGFGQEPGLDLTRQYRYDLPYLDENYALAQLPKKPQDPNEVSPLPDAPPPEPEKPLLRESLADHWQQLAEKASLASVAGVFAFLSENGGLFANHLIEPLPWPVQTSLDLDNYPGTLTLKNQDNDTELNLSGTEALAGITGRFLANDDEQLQLLADSAVTDHPPYDIIANSMAAYAQDGRFQDQRGLWRSGTVAQGNLLKTAVFLHEHADQPVTLTSTLTSVPLTLSETESWQLWLRDLPLQAGEFLRSATLSALAQDVNDPEAKSRQFNYLNGYEWRLGAEGDVIRLNGLAFYPLTLEKATVVDDQISHIEVVGRLQLPLAPEIELKDLNNAVRLTFTAVDNTQPLQLTNITCEGPFVEWPLALQNGEQTDAPRLKWHTIHLQRDDLNRPQLLIEKPQLCFFLFDVEWNVTLQNLLIGSETTELLLQNDAPPPDSGQPLLPTLTEISLNSETGLHQAWQTIQIRLGHSQRPSLQTDIRFPLMPQTTDPVTAVTSHLFLDLELRDEKLRFSQNSLQMVWSHCDPIETLTEPIHLLPGMPLTAEDCPGFAALTFTAVSPSPPAFPHLTLQSAFVETLFTSQWGHFLQSSQLHPDEALAQIFGSSAGELAFGYTVQWLTDANGTPRWDESFLVNGMVEVTNLLSWPQQTSLDPDNNTLTLPSAGQAEILDHIRHTIRVLLNQHLISSDVLAIGAGSLLFNLQPDKVWQFLAVVEHQLIAIVPNAAFAEFTIGAEQRWTTNQEVRLARPPVFQAFLQEMTGKVTDPRHGLAGLHQQSGYHQQFIKAQLLDDDSPDRLAILPNDTLIVEASAPHWIRKTPLAFEEETTTSRPSTTLQYLPNGSQLATLSNLADYFDADDSPDSWLLLTTPFLGRLQTAVYDGLAAEGRDELTALQIDPILRLHHLGSTNPGQPLPQLSLAFSSWGEAQPVTINTSPFDDAAARSWPRLDPLSLEENWFRLQNPVDEAVATRTQSVMAAFPNTPARLSRSAALRQTFSTFRHHYPPQLEPQTVTPPASDNSLEWRTDSVMVWQDVGAVTGAQPDIYAWYGTAQQLFSSHLTAAQNRAIYPAATIVPARLSQNGQENPVPVSFAISPYATLDFKPDPAVDVLKLASIELLCLAPGSNRLRPVTSILREVSTSAEAFYAFSLGWGREIAQRLCPESPLAILRYREIRQDIANLAEVTIHFTFDFVAVASPASLTKRVFRLRSSLETLRARDGHFGGMEMPETAAAFELAPPQITGVQPIYSNDRPVIDGNGRWPWGLSSLRFSSVVSAGREGALGNRLLPIAEGLETTLWWQALPYQVIFRSALAGEGPAAGLPALFRADAVDHFLPVSPQPTLPPVVSLVSEDEEEAGVNYVWQPLLPGQVRFHLLGSRAGAMFALRSHLIRQQGMTLNENGTQLSGGQQMVSGSVPVQHRMPRPVPLPENENVDSALRPWASYFDPKQNHLLTPAPADEAFFATRGDQDDKRLQIQLVSPVYGKITPDWNGELAFMMKDERIVEEGDPPNILEDWDIRVYLAGTSIIFTQTSCPDTVESAADVYHFCATNEPENNLKTILQTIESGETIHLHIDVRPAPDEFGQTCVFPLRMGQKTGFRLPLIPQFIHFEDPEYNRALASVVKRSEKQFQILQNGELVMRSIILATDRQQYNPGSTLAFRFDWDDSSSNPPPVHKLKIELTRIGANNVQWPLQKPDALAELKAGKLFQFSLAALEGSSPETQSPPILLPGERLQIAIMFDTVDKGPNSTDPPDVQVILAVEIVAESVIPVPQAAYALLRWQTIQERHEVECVRFAWGPTAVRIDLINPDDLKTEVVRRRAVFHWTDSVRPGIASGYAIQKITQTGATEVQQSGA